MTKVIKKQIKIKKHKFNLEVYPALESTKDITWEIFPIGYKAALYAFSNKDQLNKHIEDNYIYEPTNKLNVPRKFRLENTN
jgi:hypothetical protein